MRALARGTLLLATFALAACGEVTPPATSAPGADSPLQATSPVGEGVTVPGFFWLAPTVPAGGPFTGLFDATLAPEVAVVCTGAAHAGCPTLATLDVRKPGSGNVDVDVVGQQYRAIWDVPSSLLLGSGHYRIEVRVAGALVGQGDLTVVSTPSEASQVSRSQIAVIRGRLLRVVFRLEQTDEEEQPGPLPGIRTDPAVDAITLAKPTPNLDGLQTGHPELPGMRLSVTDASVRIAANATLGEVNAALRLTGATIVGGIPGVANAVPGMLVVRFTTTTHEEMAARLAILSAQPGILGALPDIAAQTGGLPRSGPDTPASWEWATPLGGNWGLKQTRVPAMWQLNPTVLREGLPTPVGVIDRSFAPHDDLVFDRFGATDSIGPHGTAVAGVIGARFNNQLGVDGVNPLARLRGEGVATGSTTVTTLVTMIEQQRDIRVINVSLGFGWSKQVPPNPPINTAESEAARRTAAHWGQLVRAGLESLEARGRALPVIVASAGNDSDVPGWQPQEARYSSMLGFAALELAVAPIVMVEAMDQTFSRADLSNIGGHLTAPGTDILVLQQGRQVERRSGTSYSAPLIAGLISYLYSADPTLPAPTLTTNPILDLLRRNSEPVSGTAAPTVDGFRALLDLDRLRGNRRLLTALLDVDDGSADGNLRVNAFGQVIVSNDLDGNGRLGDGVIDMSDFRKFRDHLLEAENVDRNPALPLFLDGAPTHPKRDLNGDQVVNNLEHRWARTDFNGDGQLSRTEVAPMGGVLDGQSLTDLQVLQSQFEDPHYFAFELPELLSSADITLNLTPCFTGNPSVRVRITPNGGAVAREQRVVPSNAQVQVFTVPAFADGYDIEIARLDGSGEVLGRPFDAFAPAELGMDTFVTPNCAPPSLSISPTSTSVFTGGTVQFGATVSNLANTAVTWTATGGTITPSGLYTAGSAAGEFTVTATSVADGSLRATAQVVIVAPATAPAPAISFQIVSGFFNGRPTTPIRYRVRFTSYPGHTVQFSTIARGTGAGWVPFGPVDSDVSLVPGDPVRVDEYRTDWFAEVVYPSIWLTSAPSPGVEITTRACYFQPSGQPMLGISGQPLCSTITSTF